tara:strand:- start:179 stop:397 length:219 start_codon:yes stop_codon:yes gene_type:complete
MALSWSAVSDEMNNMNKLIEKGYEIIDEDIVSTNDTLQFTKVFTLQLRYSLIICSLVFSSDGDLDNTNCIKP